MTIQQNKPAQTVLREWKEKKQNPDFFFWLETLGRKDEEVKEILYKPEEKSVSVTFDAMATKETYIEFEGTS